MMPTASFFKNKSIEMIKKRRGLCFEFPGSVFVHGVCIYFKHSGNCFYDTDSLTGSNRTCKFFEFLLAFRVR